MSRKTQGIAMVAAMAAGLAGPALALGACSSSSNKGTYSPDAAADGTSADAADPCPPPQDPTKSSLCLTVTPEAIKFLSDPSFDGKGLLVADVHDSANPDAPDGAPLPALQVTTFPAADAGADAEYDLSGGVPTIRFDGLSPGTVYPRVLFVDARNSTSPGPGWWIGNYDLADGLKTPQLLVPATLAKGAGKTVSVTLYALRLLVVHLSLATQPAGNAMGPATFGVMADPTLTPNGRVYGVGSSPCANLADGGAPLVGGYVVGDGPNYVFAQLDDFGTGQVLGGGAMTSAAFADGGFVFPQKTQLNFPPSAYTITQPVALDLTIPPASGAVDDVKCQ